MSRASYSTRYNIHFMGLILSHTHNRRRCAMWVKPLCEEGIVEQQMQVGGGIWVPEKMEMSKVNFTVRL